LRAQVGGARRVEHVHAHVIGIGPDAELGIIKEVRAEVESVAIPSAGGVARGRDRDAFVRLRAGAGKLTNNPAVSELVIKDDRVTTASSLANAAEA